MRGMDSPSDFVPETTHHDMVVIFAVHQQLARQPTLVHEANPSKGGQHGPVGAAVSLRVSKGSMEARI